MKKNHNVRVMATLKALLLSGATLASFSSCGEKKLEVDNTPALSPVSVADNGSTTTDVTTDDKGNAYVTDLDGETSYVETTTYTTDDEGNAYVTDLDGETSYVETTYTTANDITDYVDTDSRTTVKNDKTTTKISGTGEVTDTTARKTDKETETTKKNTTTTKKTTTTTATTKKTTTTTATTTKKTTTTTKATQPPVVSYSIDDICYNVDAFEYYAKQLHKELLYPHGGMYNTYANLDGEEEVRAILALINNGCISDYVIQNVFSKYPADNIYNFTEFVYHFPEIEIYFGGDIDFSKYSCSQKKNVGNYLNYIKRCYYDGSLQSVINDQIVRGNISSNLSNEPAVMLFYCGFDKEPYPQFSHYDVDDEYLYDFIDYIRKCAYGYSK